MQSVRDWGQQSTYQGYEEAGRAAWTSGPGATAQPPADLWCRIVEHPDGYAVQLGGADRAALEIRLASLRGAIPPQRRRWNPATRTWWVDRTVEKLFGSVSRWVARSFAPNQVQRSTVPQHGADNWLVYDSGDHVVEGWVLPPEPPRAAAATQPDHPTGRAGFGSSGSVGSTRPGSPSSARPGGSTTWASSRPADGTRFSTAPSPPAPDPIAKAYASLWLRPEAPWPVIKAAYRALATIHHPDMGGATTAMMEINAAYALLREHFDGGASDPRPSAATADASRQDTSASDRLHDC
jgi:hypothetical protein